MNTWADEDTKQVLIVMVGLVIMMTTFTVSFLLGWGPNWAPR